MTAPYLSIVAPCYNEQEGLPEFLRRTLATAHSSGRTFEVVLVNDGSRDATWSVMQEQAALDPNVVAVNLARNHGHQLALTAGLSVCRGERILIIDADLQDPPELLPDMMARMDAGADVVYGQRRKRAGETMFKLATAAAFYRIIERLTDTPIPRDTGDFRLMSRRALNVLMSMPERHRFIRGMVSWIGFRQEALQYDRDARFAGETKYPFRKMLKFAIDAVTAFSIKPLTFAVSLGFFTALIAVLLVLYSVVVWTTGKTVPGWTSIVAAIAFFSSVQLIVMGIFGEYLGRLYEQSKGRPLYIIADVVRAVAGSPSAAVERGSAANGAVSAEKPVLESSGRSDASPPPHRFSSAWLMLVFAALMALQVLLYSESFFVGPSGDDLNAPVADIWRTESQGPLVLLTRSAQASNYRPLQSLAMWAFGSVSVEHRVFWVHVLHFSGMLLFAFAAWLWIRLLPVRRFAALCGAVTLFAHPTLVAPLGGFDGFGTLCSTALMWISVHCAFRWRERLVVGVPLMLVFFVLAIGFKEYALGAAPLACLAMLCFSSNLRQGIGRAFVVGVALSTVVIGFMLLRRVTMPPAMEGHTEYLLINPITWIKNAAMFAGVLFFPGSTTWLFTHRTPLVMGVAAASIATCAGSMLLGIWWRWRTAAQSNQSMDVTENSWNGVEATTENSVRRWIVFSFLSLAGASFPAVLVFHISEMYVAGLVIPLAMLVALAADGVSARSKFARVTGTVIFVAAMVWAAVAIRSKVAELRAMGDSTERLLQQILDHVPPDARDTTVALCFPPETYAQPAYSVYALLPPFQVEQPQALWWLRPHHGLTIAMPHPTLEAALANADEYGLIMQWNPTESRFELVRSNLSAPR